MEVDQKLEDQTGNVVPKDENELLLVFFSAQKKWISEPGLVKMQGPLPLLNKYMAVPVYDGFESKTTNGMKNINKSCKTEENDQSPRTGGGQARRRQGS